MNHADYTGSPALRYHSQMLRKVLWAVLWFVLGHLSCAMMHHMHNFTWK
jgi:hypothetical protein